MRLWNPFKPHVVEFGTGGFAIRKLSLAGWICLDRNNNNWWINVPDIAKYCLYVSPVDAACRIVEYNKRKPFWKLYAY